MTQIIEQPVENLVDLLASTDRPKRWVERKLAEMAQGIIASLRDSALSVEQAREELFNLDNYSAMRRRRMSRDLKELFEWGMELGNVTRLAPDSVPESINEMSRLARGIIELPVKKGRGPGQTPAPRGRTKSTARKLSGRRNSVSTAD